MEGCSENSAIDLYTTRVYTSRVEPEPARLGLRNVLLEKFTDAMLWSKVTFYIFALHQETMVII